VDATEDSPRGRPALLPRSRWARVALLLLVLFALLRSVVWASIEPAWFGPDEDYHWLYINYIVVKHTVPDLSKPFYTDELYTGILLTHQNAYLLGPRTNYSGAPHALLYKLGGPLSERDPAPPPPRPVLHPPGYYLAGAVIDSLLWHKVSVTRMTAIRYYSAVLGALTIFFAWLLASQVLAREWEQLAAAALASVQTILAFSASTITNDVGVAVTLTATLAWGAWMLRGPPVARQGIGLGVLFSLAIMMKATMLSLVIVIGAMLAVLWRTYPQSRHELKGVLKWTIAVPAVLTGWWYVRLVIVTHSILGERGSLTNAAGAHGPGILHAPAVAWEWIGNVYRGYWFDYLGYEVKAYDVWFWLPIVAMVIVAAGFVGLLVRRRRTLFTPGGAELRIVVLLTLTALLLLVPPLALDTLRRTEGLPFTTQQARFLTPAYPGLAVIAVLALRELTRWSRRAYPIAVGVLVAGAFVFYWHSWIVWVLERFYGPIRGHWLRALLHASYDKPTFVTQWSLAGGLILALLAFIAAYAITVWGSLPSRGSEATPPLSAIRSGGGALGPPLPTPLSEAG
jgi:Dolichyl-phosphate-mannose-protein mannosyltransferase